MTTLKDLMRDLLADYEKELRNVRRMTLDDDLPDAEDEVIEELIDRYAEIIKKRFVG